MAWRRDDSTTKIGGSSLYAYTEVDWNIGERVCTYRQIGGCTSSYGGWSTNPTATLYYREWDFSRGVWGSWETYENNGSASAHYTGPGDLEIIDKEDSETYWTRFENDREIQLDCDVYASTSTGSGTGSAWLTYIVPHLAGTPRNLTAEWQSDDSILLTWDNPSTSYTAIRMMVRENGTGEFSQCWYYDGAGYPVNYLFTGADISKSYEFKCQVEYYGWGSYSNTATLEVQAPLAPTPLVPSGYTEVSGSTVRFSWIHNYSLPQSAFKLKWVVGGTQHEIEVESEFTTYMMPLNILTASVGNAVSYQIATKSEASEYSLYSEPMTFTLCAKPVIDILSPVDGDMYAGMPIEVAARYTDAYACRSAYIELLKDGESVYRDDSPTIGSGIISSTISVNDFLPDNHQLYEARVWAESRSGLTGEDVIEFTTDFTEPVEGDLAVSNDPDTGYATIIATFDNEDEGAEAVRIVVHRVNRDGTLTLILNTDESGTGSVDRYAPLNTAYRYAVTTVSSEGATKTVYFDNELRSNKWFVYWGNNVASAMWNPSNGGIHISRPQKTRVRYVGRKDPVSYDGSAVSLTETPSWMFVGQDEVTPFVKLIEDGGRGVYKSCDGWVYRADFDLTLNPSYTAIGYYGGASLSITRIAGERL